MIKALVGFIVGVVATVAITFLPSVAPVYSRVIYDCGIRVGPGVTQATISGAHVAGHWRGICIEGGSHITVEGFVVSNITDSGIHVTEIEQVRIQEPQQ